MEPNDVDVKQLAEEVRHLKREMNEMKKLIRSLLQELMESERNDDDDFFDFN